MQLHRLIRALGLLALIGLAVAGCTDYKDSSDDVQREQQEKILAEGTAQTGMPAIKNFRERKLVKDILELRDQNGLVTYTYAVNETPKVVPGHTAKGGKFTYIGESVGYGIPYATQYSNPQKMVQPYTGHDYLAIPQADPNGLFSPQSAEGTWVMLKDPNGSEVKPIYIESRILSSPFKFKAD